MRDRDASGGVPEGCVQNAGATSNSRTRRCARSVAAEGFRTGKRECSGAGQQHEQPLGLRTCDRYFMNGMIFESVWINGCEIPGDEIDRFAESLVLKGPNRNKLYSRLANTVK